MYKYILKQKTKNKKKTIGVLFIVDYDQSLYAFVIFFFLI